MHSHDTDREDLPPSRSQVRREALDVLALAERLVALTPSQLAQVPLEEKILDAVHLARHVRALAEARLRCGLAQQSVDEFLDHEAVSENRSSMRQPRWAAIARRLASGLVATGSRTHSISARSLMESV